MTRKRTASALPQKAPAAAPTPPPGVGALLRDLEREGSDRLRADMAARYGIVTSAVVYGTPMLKVKVLAKKLGRDHRLAEALWRTGVYDACMLATLVDDPARVTPAQMDRWAKDFDNWAIVDTACFNLFDRTPHAFPQIEKWAAAKGEFVKRAAFALLASCALHGRGIDTEYLRGLELIEREAPDSRNFVKKGVNWALRAIGGRKDPKLRAAARALARKLAASGDATERWNGKDALRAFAKAPTGKKRP